MFYSFQSQQFSCFYTQLLPARKAVIPASTYTPFNVTPLNPPKQNIAFFSVFIFKLFLFFFKKQLLIILSKSALKTSLKDSFSDFLPSLFVTDTALICAWLSMVKEAGCLGRPPFKSFTLFFFSIFSKKNLVDFSLFFSLLSQVLLEKGSKGFYFYSKGKLAWKALSRKQKEFIQKGACGKTDYTKAASDSKKSLFSLTGSVQFKLSFFF